MSITWSLMNISKGQQFSLMLCVLCLIVQWNCQCSAQQQATNSTSTPAVNNSITDESALNTSTENSTSRSITDGQVTATVTLHGHNHTEATPRPTTDSPPLIGKNGSAKGKQTAKEHSKPGSPKVLISLLVSGLFLAAMILVGHYQMNKRSQSPQSKRLDEEPDAQDHDSTMFSVASEDQSVANEKPKLNGEAQENGENQKATAGEPTGNGHQRKEADTEL
ncbi:uncharacterized protein LOC125462884 [Stegostoma tigrinum]|uniref:uncharacterized protein LOC125462884 n=1 Tax=Stegostoma tigrinum TaxID=3053191 RepID=UPI00202ADF18|nr:uncharacterized protein LOC125462884 [Stegostoma tigrinum]